MWRPLTYTVAAAQCRTARLCDILHQGSSWAARYNTWLLIKLTPKGVVFSFPSRQEQQRRTYLAKLQDDIVRVCLSDQLEVLHWRLCHSAIEIQTVCSQLQTPHSQSQWHEQQCRPDIEHVASVMQMMVCWLPNRSLVQEAFQDCVGTWASSKAMCVGESASECMNTERIVLKAEVITTYLCLSCVTKSHHMLRTNAPIPGV